MSKAINLSGLKTLLEPLVHLINKKAECPDWNENDPGSSNYIAGRTHYEEFKIAEIILKQMVTISDGYTELSPLSLVSGNKYIVTWMDTEYVCTAYQCADIPSVIIIGYDFSGDEYDYPFSIATDGEFSQLLANVEDGEYTLCIKGGKNIIHKIDEKYLPETQGGNIGKSGDYSNTAEIFNDYQNNIAHLEYSHAEGKMTEARGVASHAEGTETWAYGNSVHAEGVGTGAMGYASHAEGKDSSTGESASYSHAEGFNTSTNSPADHAEGSDTYASGGSSHAEGTSTFTSGNSSHAEGAYTKATAYTAHAEGSYAQATGLYSHAEGRYTIAQGDASHVEGKYNIIDANNEYLHIAGNGSQLARSNAHTLDWSGNVWYAGDVYVGSTSGTNKDDGSKKLATEEYVIAQLNALREEILGGEW